MVGGDALACGDKLVIVGRGLRAKRKAVSKASILVYARPGGALPTALGEGACRRTWSAPATSSAGWARSKS
jgi:hypothetical protein